MRILTLMMILVAASAPALGQSAKPPDPATVHNSGTSATLRKAIGDLAATCGSRYPEAAAFLTRLERVEKKLASADAAVRAKARKDFDTLQRQALCANPLVSGQPIVFVVRSQYRPGHHNTETFFPSAQHECNSGSFTPGGALKLLDVATGKTTTLVDLPKGVARDPEVSFDGKRILFSMRKDVADSYHIYELDCVAAALGGDGNAQPRAAVPRQLTCAKDADDLDPLYLPDGGIAFSSTREPKYCMCNRHIMANLYRMEADGANIVQIGKSTLFEGHGALTPDGRILYDRWEYVDRNFGDAQGLWVCNPDGTNHAVYFKNNTPSPGAVLDARFIPGADQVICTFAACHDRPWGAMAIVDRKGGTDGRPPVVRTWPESAINLAWKPGDRTGYDSTTGIRPKYEDPYPLSAKYFLCSRMTGRGEEMGIFLADIFGNEVLLHAEAPGCFDPMPLGPRVRPPAIPMRRNFKGESGLFYVQNVYEGTHMAGVKPGAARFLRVVESPEKRFWTNPAWSGQGTIAPGMNWHDFNNKRILGTAPIEADGSAYVQVPSEKFVYFQVLDEKGKMIQSMRSGVIAQSGELAGCVGCHDNRQAAPPAPRQMPLALRRAPGKLDGWHGPPREFNYLAEVQPVLTKNCLPCHDYGKPGAAKLILAPDRESCFNVSYRQLWTRGYIRVIGAGPAQTQQAYSWGSHASRVVNVIDAGHHGVKLDPESYDRLVTWLDINAPYYPTYATNFPGGFAGRCPVPEKQTNRLKELLGAKTYLEVSFDRPELSPALAALAPADPKRKEALAILQAGKEALVKNPGADMPGFVPCELDQWREKKYQKRLEQELARRKAILEGRKVYDKAE